MIRSFDYDRYHRKVDQIMKRTGGFSGVLSKQYIPVIPYTLGGFYTDCQDRERMLNSQLEAIDKMMTIDTDFIPYLEPWHGVGVYADAYGCPFEWRENDSPWCHPIVHSIEDLRQLKKPELAKAKMLNYVFDTVEFFDRSTNGEIPISVTDTQSPLDNATLICDTAFFFTATYEWPDEIKQLLQWITDLTIEASKRQWQLARNCAKPGHIMWSPTDGRGIAIAEDNLVMISRDHYQEFAQPYNEQIARAMGGLAIHSCGSWKQHFKAVSDTAGVVMCDLTVAIEVDPAPNRLEDVLASFAGRDTLVQIRMHADERDPEETFAWIDQLHGPGFPVIIHIPFNADPKITNRNYTVLRKKLDNLVKRDW